MYVFYLIQTFRYQYWYRYWVFMENNIFTVSGIAVMFPSIATLANSFSPPISHNGHMVYSVWI